MLRPSLPRSYVVGRFIRFRSGSTGGQVLQREVTEFQANLESVLFCNTSFICVCIADTVFVDCHILSAGAAFSA